MTNITSQQSNRIEGLDLIRTVAILLVVFIHGMTPGSNKLEYINNLSDFLKIFHFTWFSVGRLGVPLFFFLSGYLLLTKQYDREKTKRFFRHNFLSLLLTWEIWILIYNISISYYEGTPFNWSSLFKNMLFIKPTEVFHAWYMEVILGIYLFLPYISRALHRMSNNEILAMLLISFVYFFIVPTLNHFKSSQWHASLNLYFSGGLYGFYLIVGYLIKVYEEQLKNLSKPMVTILIFVTIAATTLAQMYASAGGKIYHIWYDFCLLPITALFIFICLKDMQCKSFSRLITTISKCSFGIYLIHVLFLVVFFKSNLLYFIGIEELRIIISPSISFIVSLFIVISLKKIPHLGSILFR